MATTPKRGGTMAGYVLADVDWLDQSGRQRYVGKIDETIEAFGGKFIVGTTDVTVKEGDWNHSGILVIIRFPTMEQAVAWYDSDEYMPLRQLRIESSRSRLMIFEGD
jgi:uncharacterized protein (DUF1330 family)